MNVGTGTADGRASLPVDLADPDSMTATARGVYAPGLQKAMARLEHNYSRVQTPKAGVSGVGDIDWAAVNSAIQTGAQTVLPIIVAQTPGTVYTTNPQTGQVMIYNQGTGGQTLPGYYPTGSGGYMPGGQYNPGGGGYVAANTPVGNLQATNIDWGMIALVGGGLVLLMMTMGGGRR